MNDSPTFEETAPRILAVEDRAEDRYLLETMLKGGGYRVTSSRNGWDAYHRLLGEGPFDLMVSDILMPEMDGYQLCAKVKTHERFKEIPFIFLTATYMSHSDETFAMNLGADRFFRKPVDMDDLLAAVADLLRQTAEGKYAPKASLNEAVFSDAHVKHVLQGLERKSGELESLLRKQKGTEEALRKSEARYRLVSSLASDYFYQLSLTDKGGWVIDWIGGAFEEMTGYGKDEIKDLDDWVGIVAPEDMDEVKGKFPPLPKGQNTRIEYRIITKSGEVRWLTDYNRPFMDDEQRVTGIIGAVKDITHEKILERQLRQSQKLEAMGTLAGGIAHDFNNILTAIIGFTELSLGELPPDDNRLRENFEEVLIGGRRARDLVRQILMFARHSEKKYRPLMVKLPVKEALKMLRAVTPSTIQFQSRIDSDSLVLGDPTEIYQVVMNLCTNGAQAMKESGVLRVSLTDETLTSRDLHVLSPDLKPGPYLNLRIGDTGCGMAPDVAARVFEPFFTTKQRGQGTGMGLSVVHGIVKSQGGGIRVESEPGKGSTFNVYFPRHDAQISQKAVQEEDAPTGTERILAVDDEDPILKLFQRNLESLGYHVTTTRNSEKALEMIKTDPERFDLMITDMTMPHMTGDVLAKKILSIRPDLPVILCTGYSNRVDGEKAMGMGIRAYLEKPVLRHDLARTVRRVLDNGH